MHVYCCNEELAAVRNTLYECVEDKLKEIIIQVEKAASRCGLNINIQQEFNEAVRLIGDDDCGVDSSIYKIGPLKRPLQTVSSMQNGLYQ